MQVNESLLRSIVTQPWQNNYVNASSFAVLPLVRNVVLSKACGVRVTRRPSTTFPTTPILTTPKLIPSINGKTFDRIEKHQYNFCAFISADYSSGPD